MPATTKGIFHNLRESEYTVSNSEIVLFFSSRLYQRKFMENYKKHRTHFYLKFHKLTKEQDHPLNMDALADITLYLDIEKRGFYVWLNGLSLSKNDVYKYVNRRMAESQTLDWEKVNRPSIQERLKVMG